MQKITSSVTAKKKEKEKEEIMENNSLKTTEKPLTRPITNNSNYYKNGN